MNPVRAMLLVSFLCSGAAAEPPLALHPDNPHYFLWRGKPTVLITSGEHYGAVLNTEFDYIPYLDELHKHGFNNTRTFNGIYREIPGIFNITDNTLAPRPGHFLTPWARSNQPGDFDGGNKFDLTKWDDAYFARLKNFIQAASERGVVVELDLFNAMYNNDLWSASPMNAKNNINGIGDCPRSELYTMQHDDLMQVHLAVTRKIVQELRDFDNLYYEVCNEPYAQSIPMAWQHKIIDAIVETERDFPFKHLISLNISNGREKVESPHSAVSIFNFHCCHPPDTVAMNYGLNKPIGENETGFRGPDDILYRTEAWDFLLAGGALYNNLDYSFTPAHPSGTFRNYQSPGGGSLELRHQLAILQRFMNGLPFIQMRPQADLVRAVNHDLNVYALAQEGQVYAIYLHVPLPGKPKVLKDHLKSGITAELELTLPAGEYAIDWWNTLSGERTRATQVIQEGGRVKLTSPAFDNDIGLQIRRTSNN